MKPVKKKTKWRKRYAYIAHNLSGGTIDVGCSMPDIAKRLGVSVYLIQSRVFRRVTKFSQFKGAKYMFNIDRVCVEVTK